MAGRPLRRMRLRRAWNKLDKKRVRELAKVYVQTIIERTALGDRWFYQAARPYREQAYEVIAQSGLTGLQVVQAFEFFLPKTPRPELSRHRHREQRIVDGGLVDLSVRYARTIAETGVTIPVAATKWLHMTWIAPAEENGHIAAMGRVSDLVYLARVALAGVPGKRRADFQLKVRGQRTQTAGLVVMLGVDEDDRPTLTLMRRAEEHRWRYRYGYGYS